MLIQLSESDCFLNIDQAVAGSRAVKLFGEGKSEIFVTVTDRWKTEEKLSRKTNHNYPNTSTSGLNFGNQVTDRSTTKNCLTRIFNSFL